MRHSILVTLCVSSAFILSACDKKDPAVGKTFQGVNVIDEYNLNGVMLNAADPDEAVNYFLRASKQQPERIDFRRGLGKSLVRAKRPAEAVIVWDEVVASKEVTNQDRVDYADALIRVGEWKKAKIQLDAIPPTHETFERYRLEAMVADSNKDWKKADSFYDIAIGLTTTPSSVMNNWGYSKMSRGDLEAAEKLFVESITYDKDQFTAKNNLVLARGAQKKYTLPIIPMSQIEKAQLLHTLALTAIKQGDIDTGKGLLQEAIDTHPRHFDEAVSSLRALEGNVLR